MQTINDVLCNKSLNRLINQPHSYTHVFKDEKCICFYYYYVILVNYYFWERFANIW